MAVAACVSREKIVSLRDNLESMKEDNVISESGIILSCRDNEELILLELCKAEEHKQRERCESLKIEPELKGEIAELCRITTMSENGKGLKRRSSRDEEILSKYRRDLVIESFRNESSKKTGKRREHRRSVGCWICEQ